MRALLDFALYAPGGFERWRDVHRQHFETPWGDGGADNSARLLLDSRVVGAPMPYPSACVALSSLKPFFFNGLKNE